jgi:fatty-acyl-CoA synthase
MPAVQPEQQKEHRRMGISAEAVATSSGASAAKAWARALARTAPIRQHRSRILSTVVDEMAEKYTDRPAVISDDGTLTYGALASRAHRYARWAVDHGVRRGDAVGLLMPNRPEYLAIWLGITRVGGIVALLNTQLGGRSLAHCINQAHPAHLIVSTDLADRLRHIEHELESRPQIWVQGDRGHRAWPHIDREIDGYRGGAPEPNRSEVTVDDRALYIYTSGTTGLPKAANVSHARLMEWSHWFAGLMDAGPDDRMFNCLPMYHSVGGVLAPGAVLTAGGSVVIRDRFSARGFWNDVVRSECTIFQYIGELCRYLLCAPPTPDERAHAIRWCCGNGLRPEVWTRFQERFHVPHILEFYASTDGNVSLVNVEGRPGAVGRVPPFLAHRFPMALIRYDAAAAAPARDARGFCVRCAPNEVGEAIGPLTARAANRTRFEGYTDADATEKKIIRHVFESGDAWVRTGDLMRQDEHGYCFFVDRIGDTFRWKGENVAASEVADVVREFGAVDDVAVYGVEIPGTEGRAGMAAVVVDGELDLVKLRQHLIARLPGYARPVFLRLTNRVEATSTFKQAKTTLIREGYDPAAGDDPLYVDDGERGAYVRVDSAVYQRIRSGQMRA